MPQVFTHFTRANGTTVDIADDGIVTLNFRSRSANVSRVTTMKDLLAEWRLVGQSIAEWEDRMGNNVRAFPERPRPVAVKAVGEH